ncbi:MAG: molecular chaperone HtpG [Pseudanabaenaceae cyanobacterium]
MLEQGNITIHTDNIFPIIKKALYSERDIFLRELISNSADAIAKLRMVSLSGGGTIPVPEPKIEVTVDKEKKTIAVADNGIGMTADEVKKYINQVAFSSAEEFVQKYAKANEQLIGHFGLGFYSAFMVAERVEIDTKSYQDSPAVKWSCAGTTEFTLSDGERTEVGTTVTLYLQEDAEEFLDILEVRRIIRNYCDFLPVPISLNGEVTNKQDALWEKSPSTLSREDYLEFYRYLYPFQEDPLFWIHLNTDYPFVVKGILYFPKLKMDWDPNKTQVKLFCNRVFVSDNCKEVIPEFLLRLRGIIDSPDIPLNVSRSFLQGDRRVRKIQEYISKKVGDHLVKMFEDDRLVYLKAWKDIEPFVKFGVITDEKFKERVKEVLVFGTTYTGDGDFSGEFGHYTTLAAYLERNREKHPNKVYFTSDAVAQATHLDLYRARGLEVLTLDAPIDGYLRTAVLETDHKEVKFLRVDAEEGETLRSEVKGEIIDPTTNQTRGDRLKALFEEALNDSRIQVRVENLPVEGSDTPPAFILLDENTRRLQEMQSLMPDRPPTLPDKKILLVNEAHPLVRNLSELVQGLIVGSSSERRETALLLCQHIFDLALLAQKALDVDKTKAFLARSSQLLARLTNP